jgi:hypothetical protein
VAVNVLNKQTWTANKDAARWLAVGLAIHSKKKKKIVTMCYIGPQTSTDSLGKQPKLRKMRWNELD